MAHTWAKFKRGGHTAAKVAGAVGAVALVAHGIATGVGLHDQVQHRRQYGVV